MHKNDSDRQAPYNVASLSLYKKDNIVSAKVPEINAADTVTTVWVSSMVSDIIIPAIRGMTSLREGQS